MTEPNPPNRPVVEVPEGVVDRAGRRLRPGSVVRVPDADGHLAAGQLGEVVGYRGFVGVEVMTEDHDLRAWPPDHLVRVDPGSPIDAVTLGWFVVDEDPSPVAMVFPVGSREIQPTADLGPFPAPDRYIVKRPMGSAVSARAWGQACLDAVAGLHPSNAAPIVARHLDAPMLRRVLVEASLPASVARLTLLVSDQDPPHDGDTAAFGQLLALWLVGTEAVRDRKVDHVGDPVVLRAAPHLLEPVIFAVREELPRIVGDAERLAIVQAGGTPAMSEGTLLAAALELERPVRHIQVPHNQPLVEADFPPLRPLAPPRS